MAQRTKMLALALLVACDVQPGPYDSGIHWIDTGPPPRDAGRDAGSDAGYDAGVDGGYDAGRDCTPFNGCHALYDRDCRCGYSSEDAQWACGRSGSRTLGMSCELPDDCAAGLFCPRSSREGVGMCRRLCEGDADCAAGEGCARFDDLAGIPCAGYCLPLTECSLDTQDCGGACYWLRDPVSGREHTFCNAEGAAADGDFCFHDPTACRRGSICVAERAGWAGRCTRVCESDAECTESLRHECSGAAAGSRYCR